MGKEKGRFERAMRARCISERIKPTVSESEESGLYQRAIGAGSIIEQSERAVS